MARWDEDEYRGPGWDKGPYFDQEKPERPIERFIADFDDSEPYELSAYALFTCVGGGYLLVRVSGCSCWPDRGNTSQTYCEDKAAASRAMNGTPQLMDAVQAANWGE